MEEPLRFIFSHSALREGWDNPNVFQICTLNDSKSTDRKRQEIGRGLRLPVNQAGERIHDPQINRLTVVANEAYDQFARTFKMSTRRTPAALRHRSQGGFRQARMPAGPGEPPPAAVGQDVSADLWDHLCAEGYLDSAGTVLPKFDPSDEGFELKYRTSSSPAGPDHRHDLRVSSSPTGSSTPRSVRRSDSASRSRSIQSSRQLWDRISQRTKYRVSLSTDELVAGAAAAIAKAQPIGPPKIRVRTVEIEHSAAGLVDRQDRRPRDYETTGRGSCPTSSPTCRTRQTSHVPRLCASSSHQGDWPTSR